MQVTADDLRCRDQRLQVGTFRIIDRCRNRDDIVIARGELIAVNGKTYVLRAGKLRGRYFPGYIETGLQLLDPLEFQIKTDGLVLLAKLDGQRQADIA